MRRNLAALAACLCAAWLSGCHGSYGRREPAELIPADAAAVLSINWQAVRLDGDLSKFVKAAEIKQVFAELNVNESAVEGVSVFSDGSDGERGSTGMILSGSFEPDEVADSLRQRGWMPEAREGRDVYMKPADGTRCAALDSGALVCGTRKAVEGVLRVESEGGASFASTDAFERLSPALGEGDHPVTMMIAFPQHLQDAADAALTVSSVVMDFAGVGALGQVMGKIGYSRSIGCAIDRDGDLFPVQLVAVMKDEEAATFVSGGITLLKGLGALAGQPAARTAEEAEALRNFQNMSVAREGDTLSIGLVLSRRSLLPQ